jgi:hypothetical protein
MCAQPLYAHGRPSGPLAQGIFCICKTICTSSFTNTVTVGQWDSETVVDYQGFPRPSVPLIRGDTPMAEGCQWIGARASTLPEP